MNHYRGPYNGARPELLEAQRLGNPERVVRPPLELLEAQPPPLELLGAQPPPPLESLMGSTGPKVSR